MPCHYVSYLTRHIIPHIFHSYNSINFSSTSEDNQAALVAKKHSKCGGGDVRLSTLSESSR